MGIRQLPSGAFQVRFQHRGASHMATYPTRELAEEAEPLLRAVVLAGRRVEDGTGEETADPARSRPAAPVPVWTPSAEQVRDSSSAAAALIDTILADVVRDEADTSTSDEALHDRASIRAARRVPPDAGELARSGPHPIRMVRYPPAVRRSEVLAYRDRLQQLDGSPSR